MFKKYDMVKLVVKHVVTHVVKHVVKCTMLTILEDYPEDVVKMWLKCG